MKELTAEYRAQLDDFYRRSFGPYGCVCDWPDGYDYRKQTLGRIEVRVQGFCPGTCDLKGACAFYRAPHPDAGVESRTPPGPPAGVRLPDEGDNA